MKLFADYIISTFLQFRDPMFSCMMLMNQIGRHYAETSSYTENIEDKMKSIHLFNGDKTTKISICQKENFG